MKNHRSKMACQEFPELVMNLQKRALNNGQG